MILGGTVAEKHIPFEFSESAFGLGIVGLIQDFCAWSECCPAVSRSRIGPGWGRKCVEIVTYLPFSLGLWRKSSQYALNIR